MRKRTKMLKKRKISTQWRQSQNTVEVLPGETEKTGKELGEWGMRKQPLWGIFYYLAYADEAQTYGT